MLNELLKITRPLFIFDTETSGTDWKNDRIVELGFEQWGPEGLVKEWRSYLNPGVTIPDSAIAVHHITNEMVQGCQLCDKPPSQHGLGTEGCQFWKPYPTFEQLAKNLAHGFSNCDFGGKNIRFDLRILQKHFDRAGVEWSYRGARIVDAERLEQIAVPRSLSNLHEKYTGKPHDDAHGALSDVRASTTVLVKQLEAHASLPRTLDALHALQWPGWIDGEGKFKFVNGVPCFGNWGKFSGKPMTAADNGYWNFIITTKGPEAFSGEIKKLASDAKLGKYPVQE